MLSYFIIVAYGCVNSVIGLVNWKTNEDSIINPTPTNVRKPCTGISWSMSDKRLLAGCFDKQKDDWCAIIWDVDAKKELLKL